VRDFVYGVMTDYPSLIIFLHVSSAVIWVGGLVALWRIVTNVSKDLSVEGRFENGAAIIKKYFLFLSPFIVIIFFTALFMAFAYKDNAYDPDGFIVDMANVDVYKFIKLKGSIWGVMTLNMFLILYTTRNIGFGRLAEKGDKASMWLVNAYLLPANILLGFTQIYIGVFLRNVF
jgi:uncharacterized membrane protein